MTGDMKTGNVRRPTHPVTRRPLLVTRLKRVKLLLCDVDGVLTDGSVFIGGAGEFKPFNIQDGFGLVLLRRAGLKIGWVSARPSAATALRARELKINFLIQQKDRFSKVAAVEKLLVQEKLSWDEVCFVGDDIVDLGPLRRAGVAVAVANAVREAKAAAHLVTRAAGGRGAVREVVEMILKAQGKWNFFVVHYTI
jgi:3-deoxy-D-manno-octulosonate 8-phosphate phosphatase (KDO 8-P phosphatase)